MGILHGQSRCRASDRGAESKINGRKMRSKSRSRELSLKGHFWTPYLQPLNRAYTLKDKAFLPQNGTDRVLFIW